MLLQDGDPLGLGGMGGDYRADAKAGKQLPHSIGVGAGAGRFGHHLGKGAADVVHAALGLGLAAAPHPGVLFGHTQQLEPDPLSPETALDFFGCRRRAGRLTQENGHYLGLTGTHHVQQQAEQQFRHLSGVGGGAGGERIS
jgi:hypothetical protein